MKFDYVTLMLINAAAGFILLGIFVMTDLDRDHRERWVPAFVLAGGIAFLTGLHMTWSWPLPGSFNVAFGETSVLFGGLLLGLALSLAKKWDLKPIGVYGFFSGVVAAVIGLQFIRLGLSNTPLLAGTGFLLAGLAGVCALPALRTRHQGFRSLGGWMLCADGLIWGYLAVLAYWNHIESFMKLTSQA